MFPVTTTTAGASLLREMAEFGKLTPAAQRYIRRSLQVRFEDTETLALIARSPCETNSICRQMELYRRIDEVVDAIPADEDTASFTTFASLIAPLVAFDMGGQKIESFAAFSFLYERLLGAAARPWLPSIFMMFASLPDLHPNRRLDLLGSVAADAVSSHWSMREPQFFPQWIEEVVPE